MASHRAVVLVSGGLDSATTLAIAREQGFECYALSVDYGQRHAAELDAAMRVAGALGARETCTTGERQTCLQSGTLRCSTYGRVIRGAFVLLVPRRTR
jgi:7-cyano-7-deazaguanine synthase in queuosine biosynthesis